MIFHNSVCSIDPSQRPAPFVTVATVCPTCHGAHKLHNMFSRSKNTSRSKEERQERAGYFWYETKSQLSNFVVFLTINTVLSFNVPLQIVVAPQFKRHMNRSSLPPY